MEPDSKPGTIADHPTTRIPRFKVLLHNDDVNNMEYVVKVVMKTFGFGRARSQQIMMEAHRNGVALCVVEPYEQAELHRDRLIVYQLSATIEPE